MRLKILALVAICMTFVCQDALALREFKKGFEKYYAELYENEDFKATFRAAKCNLCHMKGEKKEVNNPFGDALSELIEGDAEDRLKAAKENGTKKEEVEKLIAELHAALEQVEGMESPDGLTFGERIKSGQTPVVIPEGDDDEEDEED